MKLLSPLAIVAIAMCVTLLSTGVARSDDDKGKGTALDKAAREFDEKEKNPDPVDGDWGDRPRRGQQDGQGRGPMFRGGRGGPPEGRGPGWDSDRPRDGDMPGGPPEGRGPREGMGPGGPPEGRGPREGMGPGRGMGHGGPPEGRGPGRGPGSGRGPWGDMRGLEENDPEMYALVNQDMECMRLTREILSRYDLASKSEKTAIRAELEKMLDRHFEVRQKRRLLEVNRMKEQIEKLQEGIDERTKNKKDIIDRYLKRLLNESDPLEF